MTTINLQLDVTSISLVSPFTPAKNKIGLLSSITPDPILKTSFLIGTGFPLSNVVFDFGEAQNYNKNSIKTKRNNQKAVCAVIATVGGAITSDAVGGDTDQRYVSLVGSAVGISDVNIKGGVTLESYKLNKARKDYIKALSGGGTDYNDNNIFLYTNQNSQMHEAETAAWASAGTVVTSAAGTAGGTNVPANFATDFAAGGPLAPAVPAKGLIVSDDPFFRSSRAELIKQVNLWLDGDPTRYVVYPSQIYGSPVLTDSAGAVQPPKPGQSILYGPDLIAAYHLLGILARCCYENPESSLGFISAVPFVVPL
jgi:hypothetical protein